MYIRQFAQPCLVPDDETFADEVRGRKSGAGEMWGTVCNLVTNGADVEAEAAATEAERGGRRGGERAERRNADAHDAENDRRS
jgi:hypothetical protein